MSLPFHEGVLSRLLTGVVGYVKWQNFIRCNWDVDVDSATLLGLFGDSIQV
jgi:hypothetical protein